MGKLVLKDASITVDSVDLSNHFSSITIEASKDEVDVTGFGSDYREIASGLGDASITGAIWTDYDAASVDATLWPLFESGDTFDVVVKPTSDAVSATNPSYTLTSVLLTYNPLAGSVGDASSTDVTFRNATQAGIVKAIA